MLMRVEKCASNHVAHSDIVDTIVDGFHPQEVIGLHFVTSSLLLLLLRTILRTENDKRLLLLLLLIGFL